MLCYLGKAHEGESLSLLFTEALPARLGVSARMLLSLQEAPALTHNHCRGSCSKVDGVQEQRTYADNPVCDSSKLQPNEMPAALVMNVALSQMLQRHSPHCLQFLFRHRSTGDFRTVWWCMLSVHYPVACRPNPSDSR